MKKEVWVVKMDVKFQDGVLSLINKILGDKILIFTDDFPHRHTTNYKILTTHIPGMIVQIGFLGYATEVNVGTEVVV